MPGAHRDAHRVDRWQHVGRASIHSWSRGYWGGMWSVPFPSLFVVLTVFWQAEARKMEGYQFHFRLRKWSKECKSCTSMEACLLLMSELPCVFACNVFSYSCVVISCMLANIMPGCDMLYVKFYGNIMVPRIWRPAGRGCMWCYVIVHVFLLLHGVLQSFSCWWWQPTSRQGPISAFFFTARTFFLFADAHGFILSGRAYEHVVIAARTSPINWMKRCCCEPCASKNEQLSQ